ncbi:MAG: HAD hydrolase family protein [Methanomassiliicoccales archaeon]
MDSNERKGKIVIDLDGTLCEGSQNNYKDAIPNSEIIAKVREYKKRGFEIAIYTSRQMRTHDNNIGRICATTLPIIVEWLENNDVPYDEIVVGKPWCGNMGFYVDDRTIRPSEFEKLEYEEIVDLLEKKRPHEI